MYMNEHTYMQTGALAPRAQHRGRFAFEHLRTASPQSVSPLPAVPLDVEALGVLNPHDDDVRLLDGTCASARR